jgi:aconitase A
VRRKNGEVEKIPLTLRLDTQMEVDYVRRGGIMPYVLNELTKGPREQRRGGMPRDSN